MKFGIIGTGTIGRFHAQAIRAMDGGTLHSVYNHREEKAVALAAEFGVKSFSDLREFLADPELEIVTIATPSGAHFEPGITALMATPMIPRPPVRSNGSFRGRPQKELLFPPPPIRSNGSFRGLPQKAKSLPSSLRGGTYRNQPPVADLQ